MLIQKVPHYVDSILTQEVASSALQGGDVVVAWYTNQTNSLWYTRTPTMS